LSQQTDITAVFVNNRHGIQRRGQDFDKNLVFEDYTAMSLTDKFYEKSWTKRGVNKLLKKLQDIGTDDRQRQAVQRKENSDAFVCLIFQIFC